jgi:hypothetical protein
MSEPLRACCGSVVLWWRGATIVDNQILGTAIDFDTRQVAESWAASSGGVVRVLKEVLLQGVLL